MKKYILGLLALTAVFACKNEEKEEVEVAITKEYSPIQDQDLENAIIYEANIRQYSPEGTFNEFTKDIPQLKELGVKVIWLMPVFPISEKNRKAKGNLLVEDIKDPKEKEKYLGSYYAVADYEKINPDLGTPADLTKLVETAHENGMYVILDWVANHTGWDHAWMEEYPEFYTKDENGKMMHPAGTDWTDTADLNYDNRDLWDAMTYAMSFWVTEYNVDGFRCDVAHEVPTEFWNYATAQLQDQKPLFMLAESEKKDLFTEAFDMGYNWEGHHLKNELAQGKIDVKVWDEYMMKIDSTYQKDDYLMNFVTNHDENSWNGTVEERMGDAAELMTAFTYVLPGMPLIYSGQEYDMNHRLKFFEKDSIPKEKGEMWPLLEKLGALKTTNSALHGAKEAAGYERISTSEDEKILAFKRNKNGEEVVFIANMTADEADFSLELEGEYTDYMTGEQDLLVKGSSMVYPAWGYQILVK